MFDIVSKLHKAYSDTLYGFTKAALRPVVVAIYDVVHEAVHRAIRDGIQDAISPAGLFDLGPLLWGRRK